MSTPRPHPDPTAADTAAPTRADVQVETRSLRRAARVLGVVFMVIGVLGFIPGVTTHEDQLGLAGPDSRAMLFGIFAVSVLHNAVHFVLGLLGVITSRQAASARTYLIGAGFGYLLLFLYGVMVSALAPGSALDFVPMNAADHALHIGLAGLLIVLGLVLTPRPVRPVTQRAPAGAVGHPTRTENNRTANTPSDD